MIEIKILTKENKEDIEELKKENQELKKELEKIKKELEHISSAIESEKNQRLFSSFLFSK